MICLSLKIILLDILALIFELSLTFAVMDTLSLERGPREVLERFLIGPTPLRGSYYRLQTEN